MDGKNSVALRHTRFFLQNPNPRQLKHRSTLPVNVKFIFRVQYVSLSLPESTICEWTARHCLYSCKCFQKCIFKHLCDSVVVDRVLLFAEKMRQEHVIIFGTGGGFAPLDCFATRTSKKHAQNFGDAGFLTCRLPCWCWYSAFFSILAAL